MAKPKYEKITKAFRELRKQGYFARQNYLCCNNCAWTCMPAESRKKAVFYHEQDKETLDERGYCYLSWSGSAEEITDVLQDCGIFVSWSGRADRRIGIAESEEGYRELLVVEARDKTTQPVSLWS